MMRVSLASRLGLLALAFGSMPRLLAIDAAFAQPAISGSTQPRTKLTLVAAFQAARAKNPELEANRGVARWAESRREAARIFPNPEFALLFEDITSKPRDEEASPGNIKAELSQPIELGGKRGSRIRLAEAEANSRILEGTLTEIRVRFEVAQAFLKVVQAQELVKLASERSTLATRLAEIATERVRAGKIAPIEETRLRTSAALAGFESQELAQTLRSARLELANVMGAPEGTFGEATFDLGQTDKNITKEAIVSALDRSAATQKAENEVTRARAELDVERANAFPDFTLVLEANYQPWDERTLFAAGFNLPIPLFDRNQGARGMAAVQAESALSLAAKERQGLNKELEDAHGELTASLGKARVLKSDIIPGLEQGLAALETAYRQGRIGYLDVVESQESLFTMREKHIEALTRYHTAVFRIESLTATPSANEGGELRSAADGETR